MASTKSMATMVVVILVLLALQSEIARGQQALTVEPTTTQVTEGNDVTLRCSVSNKAGGLIWLRDGAPISTDSSISDPSSNPRYSIVGDDTVTFNLQIADAVLSDSGVFQCVVSASGTGNSLLQSNEATLSVVRIQSFAVQPVSTNVPLETTATLQCHITNKEGFLYWLKDGIVISNDTRVTNGIARYSIGGDQSADEYNLVIVSVQAGVDGGQYQCVVTAAGTSERIESSVVTLRIQATGQRLTIVPISSVFTVGTDALMRCRAADKSGTLSWLRNSQAISLDEEVTISDSRYSIVGNQTLGDFNLLITKVREEDTGTYHCVIGRGTGGNSNDAISSSGASLSLRAATAPEDPTCTIQPQDGLKEGDNVTVTCISQGGEPQPTLGWLRNSLEYDGRYQTFDQHSRNDATFRLTNDMLGTVFECLSSHPAFDTTKKCELAALAFELTPTIEVSLSTTTLEIKEDESGSIECHATGSPAVLGYYWRYNGARLQGTDERFVVTSDGTVKSTLTIASATISMDEATVLCEAYNRIDTSEVYAIVTIIEDDLYQIVLAVLALIAIFVFVLIIFPIVFFYCYRKQQKKMRVAPIENGPSAISGSKVTSNFFITEEALPNGDAKKLRRQSSRPKVLEHESKQTAGSADDVGYAGSRGGQTPDGLMDTGDSARSGRAGQYDVEAAQARHEAELMREPGSGRRPSYSRRSTATQLAAAAPAGNKVSLSPGEYMVRDEYERKLRELEAMKRTLADSGIAEEDSKSRRSTREGGEKRKHKHKRRDRDRDDKDRDRESHKKSKSKHRDKKDRKERKERREKRRDESR